MPPRSRVYLAGGLMVAACLGSTLWGQSERPTGNDVRVPQCRVRLIRDQVVACSRAGVLDYVGRATPSKSKDRNAAAASVLQLKEGDSVKAGEVIAKLEDAVPLAQFRVAEAEASSDVDIRYHRKATEVAKAEYDSAVLANQRVPNTYPETDLKKLLLAAERETLAIEQAMQQYKVLGLKADEAQANLETYRVRAPFDGHVTRVIKSRGQAVREGDPILELANTAVVEVEGYISARDAIRVQRGDKVIVKLDQQYDKTAAVEVHGALVFVDVKVELVNQKVRVTAEVDNPKNQLRGGMTGEMTIVPQSGKQTTAVAPEAKEPARR